MKKVHFASCNMCGKLTYMECQLCKKHVCFKSGKGMSSLSCCIDFHDDLMYGMGIMDPVELFGVQKSKFKKAPAPEVRKNKSHMNNLMTKYNTGILGISINEFNRTIIVSEGSEFMDGLEVGFDVGCVGE